MGREIVQIPRQFSTLTLGKQKTTSVSKAADVKQLQLFYIARVQK
jgi:hypothetical protein